MARIKTGRQTRRRIRSPIVSFHSINSQSSRFRSYFAVTQGTLSVSCVTSPEAEMKRFAQQFREFSRAAAYTNLVFSLFAVVAPVLLAPGMIFQPGWANGWPGLSKQSVFATVMTGFLFMMVVGVGSAASAILCAWLEKTVKRSFVAWAVFLLLEFGISVISAVVSWNVYPIIHASISADWK